jgi:hypothetical protein
MLTDEERKLLLAEILHAAKEGKALSSEIDAMREFTKIIRLSKRLYVEHLKRTP